MQSLLNHSCQLNVQDHLKKFFTCGQINGETDNYQLKFNM